jgi:hypothetical protein
MKTTYSFSVVRYIHDVVGGEFVNVGVALYSPENNFVDAICTRQYGRLSKLFIEVDGKQFRSVMNLLEARLCEVRKQLESEIQFDPKPKNVLEILHQVLPLDDSSLQFSSPGGGLTSNPQKTLEDLFERYVQRYNEKTAHVLRDKDEIWKVFKRGLDKRDITRYLRPHVITTSDYEYHFEHSWKNGQWRTLEPISFDLTSSDGIKEKATNWLGRAMALQNAKESFRLYLLLGKPTDKDLMQSYQKAENILNKISIDKVLVKEADAETFALEVQNDIRRHTEEEE